MEIQRLIITSIGVNDGFLKPLQQKVPFFKISIPELKLTLRKTLVSDYLCKGKRDRVSKGGKVSHDPH
jgi:hypothetical protein